MKLTLEELNKVLEASSKARKIVSSMTPRQKADLVKKARKNLNDYRK